MQIRVAVIGYGNLGKGVLTSLKHIPDMSLVGVFSARAKELAKEHKDISFYAPEQISTLKDEIDVAILCGGSATGLKEQTPYYASMVNVVDSYDIHADVNRHFETVNHSAVRGGKVAIISVGWDPGLFSLNRLLGEAILPLGETYTFWGKGISQGHTNALKSVVGVKDGVQYTIPNEQAINSIRKGQLPSLSQRQRHIRECYVVAEDNADKETIKNNIVTMPNYFADYETIVHFISREELDSHHRGMPHGGHVFRGSKTGKGNGQVMEFALTLDSNPEFTASVLIAYARACYKLNKRGEVGCRSVFDIPPGLLSPIEPEELRQRLL